MQNEYINFSARSIRHSNINFKDGVYHKTKEDNQRILKRFLKKILFLSFLFLLFDFLSNRFVSAYPETDDFQPIIDLNTSASEVFILGEDGFVLKPSTQTSEGDRSTSNKIIEYKIEQGDTIFGIAAKFSIRAKTIVDNNDGISQWSVLKLGKILKILPVDGLIYTPTKKETIDSIATKFKVKKEDITRQNQLKEKDSIEGKVLIIPGAKKSDPEPVEKFSNYKKTPSVYSGETSGDFIWPANGKITQYYNKWHYALDIGNRNKGPIYASANGIVIKSEVGWGGGYGNMIIIDHGNGFKTLYAHNEKLYVKVGDTVTQGQTIAWMGNTGRVRGATGIHLHFEIIQNGAKKNPLAYLAR